MSKIDRDSRIVAEFKGGKSMESLARQFKLKPPTVEGIIRDWFNDVTRVAVNAQKQKYKTEAITKWGLPWVRITPIKNSKRESR